MRDRCQIYALSKRGASQESIASVLGVSQSTVSREMCRNRGHRGYRFKQAEAKAQARQTIRSRPRKLTAPLRRKIEAKLRQMRWSPEQISGWLCEQGVKFNLHLAREAISLQPALRYFKRVTTMATRKRLAILPIKLNSGNPEAPVPGRRHEPGALSEPLISASREAIEYFLLLAVDHIRPVFEPISGRGSSENSISTSPFVRGPNFHNRKESSVVVTRRPWAMASRICDDPNVNLELFLRLGKEPH